MAFSQKALNKNTESDKAQKVKVDTFGKTNISKQNRNICWSLHFSQIPSPSNILFVLGPFIKPKF